MLLVWNQEQVTLQGVKGRALFQHHHNKSSNSFDLYLVKVAKHIPETPGMRWEYTLEEISGGILYSQAAYYHVEV